MFVRKIMSQPAKTITPADRASTAAMLMAQFNVGALPVCEAGRVVGMLTDRDVLVGCVARALLPAETPVRQLMSVPPVTIDPSATLETAAELMAKHGVRRLPVTTAGHVVGMLSAADVARGCDDMLAIAEMEKAIAEAHPSALPQAADSGRSRRRQMAGS